MSTTIRARHILVALPALMLAWVALLAGVLLFGAPAPAALVPFPPADFLQRLPPGVAVIGGGPWGVILAGEGALAPALYAAGALVVLPAGLTGCAAPGPGA